MDDTIYRQDAIDAFDCTNELIVGGEANAQNVVNYINKVVGKIKDLPSAQQEQQWIPVEERLPEEDLLTGGGKQFSNSVLITVYDKNDEDTIVDYGHTTDGEWYSETADEFIESIADWKVIAWMPLPKPYEGEIYD